MAPACKVATIHLFRLRNLLSDGESFLTFPHHACKHPPRGLAVQDIEVVVLRSIRTRWWYISGETSCMFYAGRPGALIYG